MLSTITTKGQVTIPKKLRDLFGMSPHDKVDFSAKGDMLILRPVKTLQDLRGCVKGSGDQESERLAAKEAVGQRVMTEMK